MSKKNNVNPDFYKVGGREHSEGADKGDSGMPSPNVQDDKRPKRQELPGHKEKQPKR